ncbi:hypothetical protein GH714_011331 [Hevea brasiliensis]|uniref:Uncharacterized protein n=1 Tax=Hevea brasiliensis TaxID=3981 RepID=A0A6A6KZC9_HEVBR|nr:hypothetical protein GH714_011331 [Hevea brasiliensis]
MEDYGGSDDEYYYSDDRESLDGLDNEESDFHWVPSKGPSTKVYNHKGIPLGCAEGRFAQGNGNAITKGNHARTLLIHYRWDVERLFAAFVEKGKSYLFTEAGVTVVEQLDVDSPLTSSSTVTCDMHRGCIWQ